MVRDGYILFNKGKMSPLFLWGTRRVGETHGGCRCALNTQVASRDAASLFSGPLWPVGVGLGTSPCLGCSTRPAVQPRGSS